VIRRTEPVGESPGRWAWAEVDLDAVAHNVRVIAAAAAPAQVWAVVKADAYGHGAVPVAETAIAAGATGLCVALVQEGVELRLAGLQGPILVLTEQPLDQIDELVAHRLTPSVCTPGAVAALVGAVGAHRLVGYRVHVKVDTGMHRMGAEPDAVPALLDAIASSGGALQLGGLFTHLACADDPAHPANAAQLARFDDVVAAARAAGHEPEVVHAANSAAALALPAARRDLVRPGIALYGIVPGDGVVDRCDDLQPALSLRARVSRIARVPAGDGVSYGLRTVLDSDTTIATVPVGYADGVPRRLWETGEMLVGGVRRRIVGVVTMDQVMLDCGDDDVAVGDEVVLLGRQGDDEIRAEDWAQQLGTIGYEIVCGISRRIGRRHHHR
jgi:alanine racemase